jgi:hypothetical protein
LTALPGGLFKFLAKIEISQILILILKIAMKRKKTGHFVIQTTQGEPVRAFVPEPLPPFPPIDWTVRLLSAHQKAATALGRLDGVTTLLPDPTVFLYGYVRKEAVLSSQIEGTQSSLSDLLTLETRRSSRRPTRRSPTASGTGRSFSTDRWSP